MPSISLLAAFDSVCRTGSTAAAARELDLTQGAVSRLIQSLETQLGVQLFSRERRRLLPTAGALAYAADIRKALDIIARASVNLRANPEGGTLSICILPTFGTRWLAPRLPHFLAGHPGVTINLGTRLQRFDFQQSTFDAAIHFGEADWPEAHHAKLFDERLIATCSPAFRDAHPIASAQDVLALPLLHLESRPTAWTMWARSHGLDGSAMRGMLFDQFATALQAAVHGMGLALLPEFLARPEIHERRLVPAFGPPLSGVGSYYLVWPRGKEHNRPLSSFRNWLQMEVASDRLG